MEIQEFKTEMKKLLINHLADTDHYNIKFPNDDIVMYGSNRKVCRLQLKADKDDLDRVNKKYGTVMISIEPLIEVSKCGCKISFNNSYLSKEFFNLNNCNIYETIKFGVLHEARHTQQVNWLIENLCNGDIMMCIHLADFIKISDYNSLFERDADAYAIHFLKDKNDELLDFKSEIENYIKENKELINEFQSSYSI